MPTTDSLRIRSEFTDDQILFRTGFSDEPRGGRRGPSTVPRCSAATERIAADVIYTVDLVAAIRPSPPAGLDG